MGRKWSTHGVIRKNQIEKKTDFPVSYFSFQARNSRWEDTVKTNLGEAGCDDAGWTYLAQVKISGWLQ